MIGNINSLRRQVKNVAYNYSDAQVKVREATSNDPWGPSSSLMSEISDMTYNTMAFTEIMQIIWKRLNDHGKNWRHVYKSLTLLDYLIKVGSEKVAHQCRQNMFIIQTLKDFQYIEENKDQGLNVREKAKQLVNLLKDDERLKNERARALMAKKRFAQNGIGIGSDGSTHEFRRSDTYHGGYDDHALSRHDSAAGAAQHRYRRGSELEEARPSSIGEEELQLQIALALSKEEAQREEEVRKGDDMRLQLAISESRTRDGTISPTGGAAAAAGFSSSRVEKSNAIDDLLSLQPAYGGGTSATASASAFNDPWSSNHQPANTDPWGVPMVTQPNQPRSASAGAAAASINDPWAPSAADTSFNSPPPAFDGWSANNGTNGMDVHSDPFNISATGFGSPPSAIAFQPAVTDPWNVESVKTSLPAQHTGSSDPGMPKTRNLKTPEHFLGENSALVNLDNLMGPPRTTVAGVPPKSTVTNPFMGPSLGTSPSPAISNPFAAQQRPSPTLNEMRSVAYPQPTSGVSSTAQQNQGAWGLPQPIQPASNNASAGPTNPFL